MITRAFLYRWPLLRTPVAAPARRLANFVSVKAFGLITGHLQKQHADESTDFA
jgi:hypothetical protein